MNIDKILSHESAMLESLRPVISRKLLFTLEERLAAQKTELEKLLGLDKHLADNMAKYSNVLDSQYFEQIFLD